MIRSLSLWISFVTLLLTGACATAPPPAPPPQPSYEEKLAWIVRLEDRRILRERAGETSAPAPLAPARTPVVTPAPVVPDLVDLAADADARVRRRAALALGRVGLGAGVDALLVLLRDGDADVRLTAAFGLGLVGDARAAAGLTEALADADVRVQGRAAEALGRMGVAAAAPAIGTVVARLAVDPEIAAVAPDDLRYPLSPGVEAFRESLYALADLKAWEPLAAAVLDGQGRPRLSWWPVAYALQRIEDRRAVPALLTFARGAALEAARFAVRGLGDLEEKTAVPVLLPRLDPATDARLVAITARALAQIGEAAAVEPLRALLGAPALPVSLRVEVMAALGTLRAQAALDDLLDLMGHSEPAIRGAAYASVAALDQDTFVRALSGLDPDPAWQVRWDLARALGAVERERALPRLAALLRDDDQRVVAAALAAHGDVKAPDLAAVAHEHLAKDDLAVRATAARLIGELRPPGGDAWLREAWERGKGDASHVARGAALSALAGYGLAAARAALEEAFNDPDWAIRLQAAQLMHAADPQADTGAIRPAPERAGASDVATLVVPPYTPQVYIETAKGTIQIELYVLDAPLTVANFVALARKGFYDGLPMHRVVPGFVVQGGDPRGDGDGGPGYTIRDEINDRPYLRGTVGMALDGPDTGGSQFFITYGPEPRLDGHYTVFGSVVGGMEVVDRLERWDVIQRVRVWDGIQPPTF
jgi:cyclophilin family peptidyl-prolyl cis-trans isomerase/HEAT repeat protein